MMNILKTLKNLKFNLEVFLFRAYNKKFLKRRSSTPFLSGDTFRTFATKTFEAINSKFIINEGDIIFVETHLLDDFYEEILVHSKKSFILITHNSDMSLSKVKNCKSIVENTLINRWYAQNNDIDNEKIISIPIGLENAWWHKNGIINDFVKLRRNNINKDLGIVYGFNIETNREARQKLFQLAIKHPLTVPVNANSREYRKALNKYMFVLSPPGNGIDCHRTWEALYLGVIPIVVNKSFYKKFPDFPGLSLDNWSELDEYDDDELRKIYFEKIKKIRTSDWLWASSWENKINSKCFK